jgi:hypothetical protein
MSETGGRGRFPESGAPIFRNRLVDLPNGNKAVIPVPSEGIIDEEAVDALISTAVVLATLNQQRSRLIQESPRDNDFDTAVDVIQRLAAIAGEVPDTRGTVPPTLRLMLGRTEVAVGARETTVYTYINEGDIADHSVPTSMVAQMLNVWPEQPPASSRPDVIDLRQDQWVRVELHLGE